VEWTWHEWCECYSIDGIMHFVGDHTGRAWVASTRAGARAGQRPAGIQWHWRCSGCWDCLRGWRHVCCGRHVVTYSSRPSFSIAVWCPCAGTDAATAAWCYQQWDQVSIKFHYSSLLGCVHVDTSMSMSKGSGFHLWLVEASLVWVKRSWSLQCVSAILNEIESRKCFAIKTTIFYFISNNFTNCASLTMNNFAMTSALTSYMRDSFYKLY